MGKKSFNKKRSSVSKKQTLAHVSNNDSNQIADNDNNSCDPTIMSTSASGGIYDTYKKCTEAVKLWAIVTWDGKRTSGDKRNTPKKKKKVPKLPLSTIISNLHDLAKQNIAMPSCTFRDLKIAIRLRRQVSVYYNLTTGDANKSFCEGHQWIINQLVLVYESFRNVARQQHLKANEETSDVTDGLSSMENRFAALATDCGDESSLDDDEDKDDTFVNFPTTTQTTPPNDEIVQEEERHFAIACALLEVEKLRGHIRNSWKDWVSTVTKSSPYTTVTRELLSATCISRHGILMAKSSIMGTCVEFNAFQDFEEIFKKLQTPVAAQYFHQKSKFELGQTVILANLVGKPEFNDQCGTIGSILDNGARYGVKLGNGKVISVKPTNLLPSDDLLVGLHLVYEALSTFDFTIVPTLEQTSEYQQGELKKHLCLSLLDTSFEVEKSLHCRDRRALLQFMVKQFLPLWVAFGDGVGCSGPVDSLFRIYLREFCTQQTIQFHWVFLLLCITDSCFDCYSVNKDSHGIAIYSMDSLLRDVCDRNVYHLAMDLADTSEGGSSTALRYRCQLIDEIRETGSTMATFFPWISGDLLLQGLHSNLYAASELPYHFWEEYTTILHLYSMLRQEKYIAAIPEIENTLIRMYRKYVFFRSGVPEPGTKSYVSSWQVSLGLNAQSVPALKGVRLHRGVGLSKHAEYRSGLHVTEMSRLLAIVQWQDVRVHPDPAVCFDEIHKVVCDEFDVLFCAPLMMALVKMNRLVGLLVARCSGEPRPFAERWIQDYESWLPQLTHLPTVCSWALSLADGRSLDAAEIRCGLQMVANCFGEIFGQSCLTFPASLPYSPLKFNPNNHLVSPAQKAL